MSSTFVVNERWAKTQAIGEQVVAPGPSFFSELIRSVFVKKVDGSATVVLLTAPDRGCGVSFVSSCIVAELASTGAKVLLADADALGGVRNAKKAVSLCERIGPGRVWVLGHHQVYDEEHGAESGVMSPLGVLKTLQEEFTYIVVDAPSLVASDVALVLATSVTGVILVAEAGRTESKAIGRAHNRMVALGARVFGSVYNARRGGEAMTIRVALLACSILLGAGAVQAQKMAERDPEYRIHRSDVLDLKFRYTPEYDQTIAVRPDGRVSLAGSESFVASGLTLDEFKARIVEVMSKRLVEPDISIVLKEFEKPHVLVEGEVTTPGRVELRSDLSALDAIAMAGGFKNSAQKSNVLLLRQEDGQPGKTRVLDLKKMISDKKLEEVVQLRPGDVIYVTQDSLSKIERLVHLGQFGAIYSPLR